MSIPRALADRVAIVTGGGRGQGRSHALAESGAAVVVCDAPEAMSTPAYPLATMADLEQTVAAIEHLGGRAIAVQADVRRRDDVERVAQSAQETYGRIVVSRPSADGSASPISRTMSGRNGR